MPVQADGSPALPLEHGIEGGLGNSAGSVARPASPPVFNMEDEKHRTYNGFLVEKILSILTVEQTDKKRDDLLADLLSLGA